MIIHNSLGVYWRDSWDLSWHLVISPIASDPAYGDLNGLLKDDLIGIFPSIPGLWTQMWETDSWQSFHSISPDSITSVGITIKVE